MIKIRKYWKEFFFFLNWLKCTEVFQVQGNKNSFQSDVGAVQFD